MSSAPAMDILLIEDNPSDADLVRELLSEVRGRQFEILHALDLDAARALLEEPRHVDAILLDLNLPDSQGIETVRRVRELPTRAPVIVLSGLLDESMRAEALAAGARDVIGKDESATQLLARAILYSLERHHVVQKSKQVEDLVGATPDAMIVVSKAGLVRFVNTAAEALLGRPREHFVGDLLGFSIAEGRPAVIELLRPDGPRVGEMRVAHFDWDGEPAHVASIRDITDEHRLRTELETAEARLHHVLASSEAILCAARVSPEGTASPEFEFDLVTEGVSRVLGHSVAEALQPGWWLRNVHPEDVEMVQEAMPGILAGEVRSLEYRMRHANGTFRWMHSHLTVVADDEPRAPEVVTVLVDVTDRKRLEAQIQLAQKMEAVGMLAGGVAHDFNNVLTAIYSCAESAARSLPPEHPATGELTEIQRSAEKAAALTRQLLAFGRQQVLEPRVVDMNDVVAGTGKLLRRLIGEDVKLIISLTPEACPVFVDPSQLEQIIVNLAVNGRDAMPDGGTLTIESSSVRLTEGYAEQRSSMKPGDYVVMSVIDTGVGMDEETQKRIFEPFFSNKGVGEGTGLGLATVYGIVKQSDGHIWVYSEVGSGTTIRVYFPRSEGRVEAAGAAASTAPVVGGEETILFVEDDDGVRRAGADILRSLGYKLLIARNGQEAVSILDESGEVPDLLVTDMVMPVMGGQRLANEVRKRYPRTGILFASGYSRDAVLQHGNIAAESIFLQKPYTPTTLGRKVREMLDKGADRPD